MLLRQSSFIAAALTACALLCPRATFGFDHPAHGGLPNLDKRREQNREAKALPPSQVAATEKLKERVPGLRVERDALLQTPRYISSPGGFLSGPKGEGKAISPARIRALRAEDPHRAIKAFLNEHAGVFGHGAEVIEQVKPRRDAVSRNNGLRTVVWEQRLEDIGVYEGVLIGHLTANGELVSLSSQFIPDAAKAAGGARRAAAVVAPTVPAHRAVLLAAENLGEQIQAADIAAVDVMPEGGERRQQFNAGTLPGQAMAKLTWFPMDASTLKLCWEIELTRHAGSERYRILLDAQTEEVYLRQCLTVYLSEASYRVFNGDSPTPLSPGWSTPSTNQPPTVARSLVTLSALNTNASPIGWISDGENETRGNNVDAHHDWNADDEPDLPRPQGAPFRVFDPPLDFNAFPFDYGDAAVVNLFYWCNWMHDQLYDLGFDEAAGNYQKDNFGRGGYGNDAIQADAQDGSAVNNANFTPAPDGMPGRVQMFIFTGPEPDRDGDFDTEVMLHELTHGLSMRLVGGGVGITALQSGGMGEGWSDFYALALLSQREDDPGGTYAFGAYASQQFGGLTENYYFGIRRFPYSTDLNKNPLTFKDIDPAQISFHPGVPASPVNPINPLFANEVHSAGEVWCVALWEARANLIRKHGHAAGNRLILQLVTDGMKLSPPNPNFLEARDAIILADQINNAGENYSELWAAFARRGMGFSARSPDADTITGVFEAFDLPDALFIVNPENLFTSGPQAGPFAPECRVYPLTNISTQPITWSVQVTRPWLSATPSSGMLVPGAFTNVIVCLTTNAAAQPLGSFSDVIVFSNAMTKVVQTRRANLRVLAFASMPFTEDFESGRLESFWSVTGTGTHRAEVTPLSVPHGGKYHLTLDAVGGKSSRNEVTLGLDLAGYTNVMLRFWVKSIGDEPDGPPPTPFIDEADFDGVAISEDGTRWYEVRGLRFLSPDYTELTVDLDAAIAAYGLNYNQTFRIRFNQFDNFQIPFDGLAIDDIRVTGTPARRLMVTVPERATEGAGTLASKGLVTIGAPATANLVVTLRSSDPGRVSVPASVMIPAGSDRAVFDLNVLDNGLLDGTLNATVSASAAGYFGQSASIAISDNETARLRVMLAPRAREGDGMMVRMGSVRANPKPDRDITVSLRSSNPGKLSVPATVTIPAGESSVSFDLLVGDDGDIDGPRTVTVTAHVENWTDGSDTMLILDNDTPALFITLPVALSEGNGTVSNAGIVRLSGVLSNKVTVSLTSSDTSEMIVPALVEVPAGAIEARFNLTVVNDAQADGRQTVTVIARAPNFTPGSGTMTIFDDETPPSPYQPDPADKASSVSVNLALSWKPGVGEIVSEGGFESGTFKDWVNLNSGFGAWVINDGKLDAEGPDEATPPYAGAYNAVTTQIGSGEHLLYQDVFIPPDAQSATLSWAQRIRNYAAYFAVPNQEFRVEIRDTTDAVLAVAFETAPGDPLLRDWEERTFDLSRFRGQTIRVAFHQMDNIGYLNVHLDNISVKLGAPPMPTQYDVYFGSIPNLDAAHLVGTTTNALWPLPKLALNAPYYWQIVARRGSTTTRGPVWQFTTRTVGSLHHFEWTPVASPQQVNQRFAVSLTARDDINNPVKDFAGMVTVTGLSGSGIASRIVVSEIDVSAADRTEFMNVSSDAIDMSGWEVYVYDAASWPAPLVKVTLPTGSICPPGAVFQLNELGSAPGVFPNFYTGTNVAWNATVVANPIAVLLRDVTGRVVDFVAAGSADPSAIIAPMRISSDLWTGVPIFVAVTNTAETAQRMGHVDRNSAADWRIGPNTFGTHNVGLVLPFTETDTVPVTPIVLTNFVTGVWTGFLTVQDVSPQMTLRASDGLGHLGFANEFTVGASGDLSVSVAASPDVTIIGNELAYTVAVSNSGPMRATGVMLTNLLPAEVGFISAATFNGACMNAGRSVICDLGRLSDGDVARVTVQARALAFGEVTNRVFIGRAESDPFASNNTASVVSTISGPLIYSTNIVVTETTGTNRDALLPVRLTTPCTLPVSVNFTTRDQTALAGSDYVATSGVLVFEPGVTNLTVAVPVIGDRLDEGIEQFLLILSSPTNGVVFGPPGRGRILDDDPLPVISVADTTVTEGDDGSTNYAVFKFSVEGASDLPLFVNYSTLDETATSPADYTSGFGTLVFPVGASNLSVAVPIRGDKRFEPSETFALSLTAVANAALARVQAKATILDDDAEELDHFEWSSIASPQFVDVPFFASLMAKDGLNRMASEFTGPVQIAGVTDRREVTVGTGAGVWEQPLGTLFHDSRTQVIYLPEELGGPGRINGLALDITRAPGQTMTNWTLRMKHGNHRNYAPPAWEADGWTVVYQNGETISGSGWIMFLFSTAFVYNGSDPLMVDFSFNNATYSLNGMARFTETSEKRSVFFQTDSAFGDPLTWTGASSPPALVTNRIPNIRLALEETVSMTSAGTVQIVHGVWNGQIAVREPGTNIFLRASDKGGHIAESNPFAVDSNLDTDGNGLPDSWESRYFGSTGSADGGPNDDPDHDGLTNREEFAAGTHPLDPGSAVRIVNVDRGASTVGVSFNTIAGKGYQLERTTSLAPAQWTPVSSGVMGTGGIVRIADPLTPSTGNCFYRVRLAP